MVTSVTDYKHVSSAPHFTQRFPSQDLCKVPSLFSKVCHVFTTNPHVDSTDILYWAETFENVHIV